MVQVVINDTATSLFSRWSSIDSPRWSEKDIAADWRFNREEINAAKRISTCPPRNCSIRGLAEACAASSIQAFSRGWLQRKRNRNSRNCNGPLRGQKCGSQHNHHASLKTEERIIEEEIDVIHGSISKGEYSFEIGKCDDHSSVGRSSGEGDTRSGEVLKSRKNGVAQTELTMTELLSDLPNPLNKESAEFNRDKVSFTSMDTSIIACAYPEGVDGITPRKEMIESACRASFVKWKQKPLILQGVEVLNLLNALGLVEEKELFFLTEALGSNNCVGPGISFERKTFIIRLDGSLKDFRTDLLAHWETLSASAGMSTRSFLLRTSRHNRISSNVAKMARKHLLDLISPPTDAVAILEEHTDVLHYDDKTVRQFVRSLGVQDSNLESIGRFATDLRTTCARLEVASSVLQRRVRVALDIIDFISRWEAAFKFERHAALEREQNGPFGVVVEGLRKSVANLRAQIDEKDAQITRLNGEISRMTSFSDGEKMPRLKREPTKHSVSECASPQFVSMTTKKDITQNIVPNIAYRYPHVRGREQDCGRSRGTSMPVPARRRTEAVRKIDEGECVRPDRKVPMRHTTAPGPACVEPPKSNQPKNGHGVTTINIQFDFDDKGNNSRERPKRRDGSRGKDPPTRSRPSRGSRDAASKGRTKRRDRPPSAVFAARNRKSDSADHSMSSKSSTRRSLFGKPSLLYGDVVKPRRGSTATRPTAAAKKVGRRGNSRSSMGLATLTAKDITRGIRDGREGRGSTNGADESGTSPTISHADGPHSSSTRRLNELLKRFHAELDLDEHR